MTNNILDIQAEIDMLKQKLNQYDTKDENTQLQEPDSDSDSDSDSNSDTSDSHEKTSLTKSTVVIDVPEEIPEKVPEKDVPEEIPEKVPEKDVPEDKKDKEDKKMIKEAYAKVRENLKVFEEIIIRLIKQYNGLDLYDDEIQHLEGIYETELKTFEQSLKNIINRLPVLVDLDEKQYDLLERRLELCENRFVKFIKSF